MTQHVAYKWQGHLYCEGDIVAVLTMHQPWIRWREYGGDPAAHDAEYELDDIAEMFNINRKDNLDVAENDFPRRISNPPEDFCVFCKRWFQ